MVTACALELTEAIETQDADRRAAAHNQFFDALATVDDPTDEIAAGLQTESLARSRWKYHLWVEAAMRRPSPRFLPHMCAILESDEPSPYLEYAVEFLFSEPSPTAIPGLLKSLHRPPSVDPMKALAIKAIEAMCVIGTEEALGHVRDCLKSSDARLRQEAALQLEDDD
jgi:HEAT repeat protein